MYKRIKLDLLCAKTPSHWTNTVEQRTTDPLIADYFIMSLYKVKSTPRPAVWSPHIDKLQHQQLNKTVED